MFFIAKGNNKAIYILKVDNWRNISSSMKFYNARTRKQKLFKEIFGMALFILGKTGCRLLKEKDYVNNFIGRAITFNYDFELEENCSVLISPTRDKVIVNHHDEYYQKFAFGKSFRGVENELLIYELLQDSSEFEVSYVLDSYVNVGAKHCYIKLAYPVNKVVRAGQSDNLVTILLEFFNSGPIKKSLQFADYINMLLMRYRSLDETRAKNIVRYIGNAKAEVYGQVEIPMGLVHRDFKPWNTLKGERRVIYDFEETVLDGPPLEDLLNYYVDPIIRYRSPEEVFNVIFSKEKMDEFITYLNQLGVDMNFEPFLLTYILERILFWSELKDEHYMSSYQNFLDYFLEVKKSIW